MLVHATGAPELLAAYSGSSRRPTPMRVGPKRTDRSECAFDLRARDVSGEAMLAEIIAELEVAYSRIAERRHELIN
jgi:hypothetical protein